MNTLTCRKCGELQPIDNFSTYDNGRGIRYRQTCRNCRNEYQESIRANGGVAPEKPHLTEKPCRDCKVVLPIESFRWNTGNDGKKRRDSLCSKCRNRRTREWYAEHRSGKARDYNRFKKYGVTIEVYRAMLEEQGGACAMCGDTEMPIDPRTREPYQLAVDHCHKTGRVRSLLCPNCNNGLGCFRDDTLRLRAAINYLMKHSNDATS